MKLLWRMIERYYPWLLLLLGMDCFCAKQVGDHPPGVVPGFSQ